MTMDLRARSCTKYTHGPPKTHHAPPRVPSQARRRRSRTYHGWHHQLPLAPPSPPAPPSPASPWPPPPRRTRACAASSAASGSVGYNTTRCGTGCNSSWRRPSDSGSSGGWGGARPSWIWVRIRIWIWIWSWVWAWAWAWARRSLPPILLGFGFEVGVGSGAGIGAEVGLGLRVGHPLHLGRLSPQTRRSWSCRRGLLNRALLGWLWTCSQ